MLKYASSAAHIAGKPYTSSETFTWLTEHFRTSLSQCKPDMDLMFVSGVNHMFFHVKDGQLVTSGGTGYKALVVPAAHLMPSDVLAHLYELAKQGATIVFLENYPTDVPGYGQLEQKRQSYQRTLGQLPAVSFSETTVTPIGKGRLSQERIMHAHWPAAIFLPKK